MRPPAIAASALFPAGVVVSVWALVARLTGTHVALPLALLAGGYLAIAVLLAAALATLAFLRREWWWGAGLLVLWPFLAPLYLFRRSGEAQV